MKNLPTHLLLIALLSTLCFISCSDKANEADNQTKITSSNMYEKMQTPAPVAKKEAKEMTTLGDTRIDNYFWMRLTDEQKNAETPDAHTTEVTDYLNAENSYHDKMTSHLKEAEEEIFQEMKGRIQEKDESVPYKDNGYFYLTRYEEGQEYPIYSRKKGSLDAQEEIMLNVNEMAKDFDYFAVAGNSISPDNQLIAYGEDTLSRRIYTIKVKNLATGEMYDDVIPNTTGRAVWANDNKTLFYTVKDETLRGYKIFKHKLGTPATADVEIFHEKDETFSTTVYKTKSKKYIVIACFQTVSNEYHVVNADTPDEAFKVIQPRERNLEYSVSHYGNDWYIRTNLDARNFRLMKTPETATTKENWTEVIPHREDVLFEDMDIFKDYLVLSERKEGLSHLRIRPWKGEEHYMEFTDEAWMAYTSVNREFDTDILRFGYQSMTTPSSTFDYNMATKERTLLKQTKVLGGFDSADYESKRAFVTVRDGAKVPVSIVYKKSEYKVDGTNPCLLYGYGSYGASMEPYFSSARLSLLDRGFVYVIAHIRGGEEMGRHWYEDGKLLNKKNTFFDFIDCGKWLKENKYSGEDNLFAMGGSAGGLLMGAVINYEPDMWKGVVAAVPFVDVVSTMLDTSIPLTTGEFDEWGNPALEKYYAYIKSYSPYDNVEAKNYPAMLVTTGLHDSQVQYWEPAKWVAKLREMKTDNNPLLLRTNMEAGHGGASGRFKRLQETAKDYAFILDLAGKIKVKG
jgi:oligopeptidase B